MPPPPACPFRTPASATNPTINTSLDSLHHVIAKPPLPTAVSRGIPNRRNDAQVLVPPLVAGALVASFAKAVAEGLHNELLTHYYLSTANNEKVSVNVDRVLDRLLAEFTRALWDELFEFYTAADSGYTRQVAMLFDGPIRQIVLVLNGPETSTCLLERIGPGLSRRKASWSKDAAGIELGLALQLVCGYWHREYPELSPGGSPEEISRVLCARLISGRASRGLISDIRRVLMAPHYVQMHILETAVWDRLLKRRRPPPRDGFHVAQFRFECQIPFKPGEYASPEDINLCTRQAITGTATECQLSTVVEYVDKHWLRCGRLVLDSLNDAVKAAYQSQEQGEGFVGMAIWDGDSKENFCPGLRLLHFEVESGGIQLTASAWSQALVEIFQEMGWLCAALGASEGLMAKEAAVEIVEGTYEDDIMFFNCSLSHVPVLSGEGVQPLLGQIPGAVVARGFPIETEP